MKFNDEQQEWINNRSIQIKATYGGDWKKADKQAEKEMEEKIKRAYRSLANIHHRYQR